jgi:hypothetical protein
MTPRPTKKSDGVLPWCLFSRRGSCESMPVRRLSAETRNGVVGFGGRVLQFMGGGKHSQPSRARVAAGFGMASASPDLATKNDEVAEARRSVAKRGTKRRVYFSGSLSSLRRRASAILRTACAGESSLTVEGMRGSTIRASGTRSQLRVQQRGHWRGSLPVRAFQTYPQCLQPQ